jgi:hypothetical protein
MKPAKIFQQYIWLVTLLMRHKRLTLEEISQRWEDDKVIDGKPLLRSSFYRHKDAVLNMFGIIIECDTKHGYKYYIANPDVLDDNSIERWMLSTLTVNTALSDSASLKDRIMLENVPAGEEFLQTIIEAMRTNRKLRMGYQKFGTDGYMKTVCPYAVKRWEQRWYLLALNDENNIRKYALDDRMTMIEMTDETFEMPEDFSSEAYFADYYGVTTDGTPLAHVVIRLSGWAPDYLRTLPLHHSQREVARTADYTDFALDIRPTNDFINKLMWYGDCLEVLEPADLRLKIHEILTRTLNKY